MQHMDCRALGPLQRRDEARVERQGVGRREDGAGRLQVHMVGEQHPGDRAVLADEKAGEPVGVEVGFGGIGRGQRP
jgi:hypothetical protein